MTDRPITPPPELVRQWVANFWEDPVTEVNPGKSAFDLAARAADWGYDQHERALLNAMHATVPPDLVMAKAQLFEINPHPAIPPSDLLKQWEDLWHDEEEHADVLLIRAFQAGADQELEACVEWLGDAPVVWNNNKAMHPGSFLRDARRPKPPSLAEEALALLEPGEPRLFNSAMQDTIRRALERLQQLENNQ